MRFLWYSETQNPQAIETAISNTLERMGHTVCRISRDRKVFPFTEVYETAELYKPECFILSGGSEMEEDWLRPLPQENPKSVFAMWHTDRMSEPSTRSWFEPVSRLVDVCFTLDSTAHPMWDSIRRQIVWPAIDPTVYVPINRNSISPADREHYGADVAFIGMPYEAFGRKAMLDKVQSWCDANGKTLKIWGHWSEYVLGASMAKVVACSKILLTHERGVHDNLQGAWSDRTYQILAYGGFCLAHYEHLMETEFKDREHLVYWRDDDDLIRKIAEWLPSETFRPAIATGGKDYVRDRCRWEDRLPAVIETIERLLKAKR